ncbi:MAG TPA: phage baseplate assembly protein V [Blastocatellia bacterium]|nr:phage baseplate assembly protein V [Blastocatellia bacterium]
MTDDLLARLIEKVESRYYGKYRAFVVDNADPENRGRLRLRVPSILGNEVVSGWALPCAPYGGAAEQGFFFIPEVDAGVWVEFEAGNLDFPIWVGTFWSKPGGSSEVPSPAKDQSPPTSKIIKTLNHTIELADESGSEAIKITDAANSNTVVIDKDGMKLEDANSNKVTLDDSGIKIEDKNGNLITMDSSSVTIKSSQIKIGDGATEPLVLGNQLVTALNNWVTNVFALHMHTGNLGAPTTPPVPGAPLMLTPALSQTNMVK